MIGPIIDRAWRNTMLTRTIPVVVHDRADKSVDGNLTTRNVGVAISAGSSKLSLFPIDIQSDDLSVDENLRP